MLKPAVAQINLFDLEPLNTGGVTSLMLKGKVYHKANKQGEQLDVAVKRVKV